jgi:hypothetical protein
MSYTLELYFKPAVEPDRMLRYFAERKHYKIAKSGLLDNELVAEAAQLDVVEEQTDGGN